MEIQAGRPQSDTDKHAEAAKEGTSTGLCDTTLQALSKLRDDTLETIRSTANLIPRTGERLERFCQNAAAKKPDHKEPLEWVAVVNVTTKDFGRSNHDDIKLRLEQLKSLTGDTKDKPVAIVVQTAVCDVAEKDNKSLYQRLFPNPYHTDRYLIYQGRMEKLSSANSGGYAADVKDLLSLTYNRFQPKNLILYNDSHGNGNQGLAGDTGRAKVEEFVNAVRQGTGGKTKIVIDFDACLMGQNGVLQALKPVADHVVASAELEGGLGQDLTKSIRRILANPKITPDNLSDEIVETARLQAVSKDAPRRWPLSPHYAGDTKDKYALFPGEEVKERVPVRTLAHYDLKHYDNFRDELNKFGSALTNVMKDPVARGTIDNIIATIPDYGGGDPKRDLKSFVESVLDAVAKGKLPDPEAELRVHGGRLLDYHKKLVPSYAGFYEYAPRGGLTFFAPRRGYLDYHERARYWVWACDFKQSSESPPDLSKNKDDYLKTLNHQLKKMQDQIKADAKHLDEKTLDNVNAKWFAAQAAVKKLQESTTQSDTFKALNEMRTAAQNLEKTEYFQYKLREHERKLKKEIDEYYKDELVNSKDGWGQFREALRRLD